MKPVLVMEQHELAKAAIARWSELKSAHGRAQWEQDAEEIARLIRPQRGGFSLDDPSKRDWQHPLNSEPILAQSSFAAGIYDGLTNPATRWVGFETGDEDLNKWQPMAEWNDRVTAIVLRSFSPSVSSFYSSTFQAYSDIAAFGNAGCYDEIDRPNRRFTDVTVSLANIVVDIDAHGRVVEFVRKMMLTPRQAVREYGEAALPEKIVEMAREHKTGEFTFYQHVFRNTDYQARALGPRGKRWVSVHACEVQRTLVRRKGYDDMPAYFPRWDVDSGHTMGTGPGYIALASARKLHLMDAATLRAAQKASDPTLLAPDRDAIPLDGKVRPGEVLYGGVNMRGEPMVRPLGNLGDIGITESEKAQAIEACKDAFYYSIMSLSGRTGVTQEETRIMEEARLRNWAPNADRVMEEYGAPKAERRFRMLWAAGQIPPPPDGVPEGIALRLRYQSAAQAALNAREGIAIRQFIGDITPLAQVKPRYLDRVNDDDLIEALHDANPSLPASILRSREEADKIAQERAQQEQQAQAMEAAQAAGGVARDLGAAVQAAGGRP